MESISELLDRRGRDDSAKPFCFFEGARLSFGELDDRVKRLASGFDLEHSGYRVRRSR